MLWILLVNQFLASLILYFRSNISGLLLFRTDSIISVLDRVIMIGICSVLLWGDVTSQKFRIEWFIYAQFIAYAITAITSFIIVAMRAGLKRFSWDKLFFLMILKKSYPFALLILLMSFYNRIDSVMLERLLPDGRTQAGIYAQAFRLLEASNMIAYLFAGILLPMFAHMLKRNEKVDDLLRLSFSMIGTLSVAAGIISIFYGEEIMSMLYTEHTEISSGVFQLLMVTFFAISTTYIYGTLLTANNNLKALNIMAASAMGLNILLNVILIPRYSVTGAAVASMITQYATALTQVILGHRILRIKTKPTVILRFVIFTLLGIMVCYFTDQLIESFILKILFSGALMFASATAIGLLNIKEIARILNARPNY